jgi:hypothetical protein
MALPSTLRDPSRLRITVTFAFANFSLAWQIHPSALCPESNAQARDFAMQMRFSFSLRALVWMQMDHGSLARYVGLSPAGFTLAVVPRARGWCGRRNPSSIDASLEGGPLGSLNAT